MIIAIDLDEVVFNFIDPYFAFLSKKYGKPILREMLTSYSARESGLIPEGETYPRLIDFGNEAGFDSLPVLPGAIEGLQKLMAKGHGFIFITNRLAPFKEQTKKALDAIGYGWAPLFISDDVDTKGRIIARLGEVKCLIDDSPSNINDTRKHAPYCETILMTRIEGSIRSAYPHLIVSDWADLETKRPELF